MGKANETMHFNPLQVRIQPEVQAGGMVQVCGLSGRSKSLEALRITVRITCRIGFRIEASGSHGRVPMPRSVWKFGALVSRSATTVSISVNPDFSSIEASTLSEKPSQRSA